MSPQDSKRRCYQCSPCRHRRCMDSDIVKLSDYRPGQRGKVVEIDGDADFRLRMMEMGFVRDADIEVVKYAPLYDPIEFIIKGYHLVLRRDQAADILMDKPSKASGGSHV